MEDDLLMARACVDTGWSSDLIRFYYFGGEGTVPEETKPDWMTADSCIMMLTAQRQIQRILKKETEVHEYRTPYHI